MLAVSLKGKTSDPYFEEVHSRALQKSGGMAEKQ
jgi:hypothetical protein